jgi:hypothetical protein
MLVWGLDSTQEKTSRPLFNPAEILIQPCEGFRIERGENQERKGALDKLFFAPMIENPESESCWYVEHFYGQGRRETTNEQEKKKTCFLGAHITTQSTPISLDSRMAWNQWLFLSRKNLSKTNSNTGSFCGCLR